MNTLNIEEELAKEYKYKPLSPELSAYYRQLFIENIPNILDINGNKDEVLYTMKWTPFCRGYSRIVVGDYGAFIEIDKPAIFGDRIIVKKGQEYRITDPKYSGNVKYHWYTISDGSDIKIYYQVRGVKYADYQIGKYYVSPHEILVSVI